MGTIYFSELFYMLVSAFELTFFAHQQQRNLFHIIQ